MLAICDLLWHSFLLSILIRTFSERDEVYKCSLQLYHLGVVSTVFYSYVVLRQIILLVIMTCANDLAIAHWKGKLVFLITDTIIVPPMTVYATVVIIQSQVRKDCWIRGRISNGAGDWADANM